MSKKIKVNTKNIFRYDSKGTVYLQSINMSKKLFDKFAEAVATEIKNNFPNSHKYKKFDASNLINYIEDTKDISFLTLTETRFLAYFFDLDISYNFNTFIQITEELKDIIKKETIVTIDSENVKDIVWDELKENFGVYKKHDIDFFIHTEDVANQDQLIFELFDEDTKMFIKNYIDPIYKKNIQFIYFKE